MLGRPDSHLPKQLDELSGHWCGRYRLICDPISHTGHNRVLTVNAITICSPQTVTSVNKDDNCLWKGARWAFIKSFNWKQFQARSNKHWLNASPEVHITYLGNGWVSLQRPLLIGSPYTRIDGLYNETTPGRWREQIDCNTFNIARYKMLLPQLFPYPLINIPLTKLFSASTWRSTKRAFNAIHFSCASSNVAWSLLRK